ncbi:MAG: glycosyltransferase family 2 protein [Chitinophagaceae bacterium]|nr:glycosyltransferase family 2 protein [Chitinophagaceae bacterium]
MQKISAVIITFNEEKKITACLASLQGIADEIVVLDSFSSDKTPDICKQFGVKFYQQSWTGYGQQKNDAAAKASHDYILSLDADECLSPVLQKSLIELKKTDLAGVYRMNRLNNFYGYNLHHGNAYPDATNRLYNRRQVKWSLRKVHEFLELPASVGVTLLKGDILHKSKDTIQDHIAGINKYSTLSAEVYFENNKKGAFLKLLFSPAFTFLKAYFFRLGFLDGYTGFVVARINAQEVFLKYSKLLLLQKLNK